MPEESQPSKGKEFMAKHGEKLGLGLAAAILLGYLIVGVAMAGGSPDATKLEALSKRVEEESKKEHEKKEAIQDPYRNVEAEALLVYQTIPKVNSVKEEFAWIGSLKTIPDFNPIKANEVKPLDIVMPKVTLSSEVSLDGVALTWSAETFSKEDAAKLDICPISEFVIERKEANGDWKAIQTVDNSKTSYQDHEIKPKSKYAYRVTVKTEHAGYRKTISSGLGKPSPAVDVTTLGVWRIVFDNLVRTVSKEGEPDYKPGSAYVTIEKYDPKYGKVSVKHIHKLGDTLGVWEEVVEEGKPPVLTGVHRTFTSDNKSVHVDFDTKSVLRKLNEKVFRNVERLVCTPKVGPTGEKTCPGPQKVIVGRWVTTEVVYADPDLPANDIAILRPERKDSVELQDQLCEQHGGKKTEPKGTDSGTKDTGAKTAREKDADKLLTDAKQLEKDKKGKDALDKYKKLLSDFADTEVVKKNRKDIEKSIKALGG